MIKLFLASFFSMVTLFHISMFKTHLITSWRYMLKHKSYFFINVFGLSAGLAGCLLIFFFILNETSYDRFHENAENIYRVSTVYSTSGNVTRFVNTPPAFVPGIGGIFPEINKATRMRYARRVLLSTGEKSFYEDYGFYADSLMLEVFSFELLSGDCSNALDEPNSIVMTEELALKYFGNPRPIGELIRMNDEKVLRVTGILAPIPKNSHLQFDFLISFPTYTIPEGYRSDLSSWTWAGFLTYILVEPNTNISSLTEKFDLLFEKRIGPNLKIETNIQQLHDIYLGSRGIVDDLNSHIQAGSSFTIYSLGVISILILLIGGFNFMNLTVATSLNRGREVGLRKVLGANKKSLVLQFLFDTVLISILALVLAIVWSFVVYLYLRAYLGWDLSSSLNDILFYLPFIIVFCILLGIISGLYPSFLLAGFNTLSALKGRLIHGKGIASNVRIGLVVVQFCISIGLIATTFIVTTQIEYMRAKSLGLDKENLVTIKLTPEDMSDHYGTFKNILLQNDYVINVGKAQRLIGEPWPVNHIEVIGSDAEGKLIHSSLVGFDYMETLDVKLKEGRTFSREFPVDSFQTIILNEKAVEYLGLDNPIGKSVDFFSMRGPRTIVGVVEDFNFSSLHDEITPLVMIMPIVELQYMHVRLAPGNIREKVAAIEKDWERISPGVPLDLTFMDDHLSRLYDREEKLSVLISGFSVLAVLLACLGLFGLTAFAVERRIKEIGIRKVLGATVSDIVFLFSKDFLKLVVISNVVAWPLAYFFMNKWLQDFAYRIDISWWLFILSGGIALLIAIFTISFQAIKAATTNPVDSLRNE